MADLLPPPYSFGVDSRFDSWRQNQDMVVQHVVDSEHRLIMPVCPTGFGKSLMYIVSALINGGSRAVILTSTRALQDQLKNEHEGVVVDLRGKDNYPCKMLGGYSTCGKGPCNWGMRCPFVKDGCLYYDQVKKAMAAPIISTNYAYWMNRGDWGYGDDYTFQFSTLICDEAHELPEILSSFLTKEIIGSREGKGIKDEIVESFPKSKSGIKEWIRHWHKTVSSQYEDVSWRIKEEGDYGKETLDLAHFLQRLWESTSFINHGIEEDPENMIVYKSGNRITSSVVWPYHYTESTLFKGIEKVILTSATVTPKTIGLLGIDQKDVDVVEVDHPFPLENRILNYIHTIGLNYRTTDMEMLKWLARIDQILEDRLDRKGIIHSVSYKRQKLIMESSDYTQFMIGHNSRNTIETVERFKSSSPPAIFVSPVMTTGYDFPDDEIRYQIIGKIAYPDTSDPIIKRRMQMDRDYAPYIAMQRLIQTCGRGVRNKEDWCENFIIDNNIEWFIRKYKSFAPKWFQDSFRTVRVKKRSTPMKEDVPKPRPV